MKMNILSGITPMKGKVSHGRLSLAAAAGLLFGSAAFAQGPAAMAPPVQINAPTATGVNASADSVFNWREIPANQEVPLTRAAFDQGGYQLYDTVGETIVVPFTDQNLYVMKFAQSSNGKMYFVNDGAYPVLYVPKNSYLENATVSGGRWYPFGEDFHPAQPVFLGIAPSWSAYIGMGWYPDMICSGGYWSDRPFFAGSVFLPSAGLFFAFGGHSYYGWDGYRRYVVVHPAPYRIAYYHHDFYRWAARPHASLHPFGGVEHIYYAHQPFGGVHSVGVVRPFRGASASWHGAPSNEHSFGGTHGGAHTFGGAWGGAAQSGAHSGDGHIFSGGQPSGDSHPFGGHPFGGGHSSGDGHSFGGGHSSNGGHSVDGSRGGGHGGERRFRG